MDDDRFSKILRVVRHKGAINGLTIGELISIFGPRGHSFVCLLFVLPFLQPIPIPGISTFLGLAIAFVSFRLAQGRPPWIPERVSKIQIEKDFLVQVVTRLESLLIRVEKFVRPRGSHLISKRWFQFSMALLLVFHALILALPLPIPFSNFFPALVLFLITLGLVEEDIVVLAVGALAVIVNATFFAFLGVLPWLLQRHLVL